MKKIIITLLTAALFSGCSKDNTGNNQGPVITLNSPASNQSFTAGQTITVNAAITALEPLLKTQIHVSNKTTGADVLHMEEHPGKVSATISGSFVAVAGATYKVEVEAVDNAARESKVEITVTGK